MLAELKSGPYVKAAYDMLAADTNPAAKARLLRIFLII